MAKLKDGFQGECAIVLPGTVVRQMESDPFCRNLHVTDIGYYPTARYHFRERREPISQYILIYCTRGAGWYELAGKRYSVGSDQLFILPAEKPHAYGADLDDPWTIYWVHFKGEMAGIFAEGFSTPFSIPSGDDSRISTRLGVFEEIYRTLKNGYSSDNLSYSAAALYYFLGSIKYLGKYRKSHETHEGERDIVETAIHFMRENLSKRLTLADIARHVNYSPSHFSAVFSRRTGYAPVYYFNQLKIQAARRMIREGRFNFTQIAARLGFQSVHYFSRRFHIATGMSPSEYERSVKMLSEGAAPLTDDCANNVDDCIFPFPPSPLTIESDSKHNSLPHH